MHASFNDRDLPAVYGPGNIIRHRSEVNFDTATVADYHSENRSGTPRVDISRRLVEVRPAGAVTIETDLRFDTNQLDAVQSMKVQCQCVSVLLIAVWKSLVLHMAEKTQAVKVGLTGNGRLRVPVARNITKFVNSFRSRSRCI